MKLRIDYHFHPNLPKGLKRTDNKAQKIWQKFEEKNINCVIITEHAYKNPKRAFDFMWQNKPADKFCFPGVECLTREGIDVIVFSLNHQIYDYAELKPYQLSYFELLEFIGQKADLYAYVPHPYTLGLTSVLSRLGQEAYQKAIHLLESVEISNGAFDNLLLLFNKKGVRKLMIKKQQKMHKVKHLPVIDYPQAIKFLAVGSDAHHLKEIGNCYEVNFNDALDEVSVFKTVSNNLGQGQPFHELKKFSPVLIARSLITTLHEVGSKKLVKYKSVN